MLGLPTPLACARWCVHLRDNFLERGGGGLTLLLNKWHLKGLGAVGGKFFCSCITIDKIPLDMALNCCCHYRVGSGCLLVIPGGHTTVTGHNKHRTVHIIHGCRYAKYMTIQSASDMSLGIPKMMMKMIRTRMT